MQLIKDVGHVNLERTIEFKELGVRVLPDRYFDQEKLNLVRKMKQFDAMFGEYKKKLEFGKRDIVLEERIEQQVNEIQNIGRTGEVRDALVRWRSYYDARQLFDASIEDLISVTYDPRVTHHKNTAP